MPHPMHAGPPALPWASYVDPESWTLERARCFRGAWHHVGHADELAEVGARRPVRALDVPVLLVRGDDGRIRAFLNTCPHRGSTLATGCSVARTIQCPYHAWTFGLDGALRAAPRLREEVASPVEGELPSSTDLVPLRIEQWGPLLFVALDDDAPALEAWLGPVPGRVEAAGVDVDDLGFVSRSASTYDADWKVLCENYLECYHCRVAHPGFSSLIDVAPGRYELQGIGRWASQRGAVLPESNERAPWTRGSVTEGSFHYVFPNLMVNVVPGAPNLSIGPVIPLRTGATDRVLDFCLHADWSEEQVAAMRAWDDQVGLEDCLLVEGLQAGMTGSVAAGREDRSRLLPASEQLVSWFAGQVRASLGDA